MSIMNLNKPAETETQPIFILRGVSYLPHYIKPHKWVGPGREHERKEYSTTEMIEARARLSTIQLWKRSWTDELKGWKIL